MFELHFSKTEKNIIKRDFELQINIYPFLNYIERRRVWLPDSLGGV